MTTTYQITGALHHGTTGKPTEEINLTGTFTQLTNELFEHMPAMSSREYEETTSAGYIYWDTDTSGLDETDADDIEEAKSRGLVLDESIDWFVEAKRREQTAAALHAYAVEALEPDAPSHLEVKIIEG